MADILTKKQRSSLMSRIKGKNNKGTELVLRDLLRAAKIKGWRRHLPLPGTPDFSLRGRRLAIFVDGCYWHGCRSCQRNLISATNRAYWADKIGSNRRRDQRVNRKLRAMGWKVVRIWEHSLKKQPASCLTKIRAAML